MKVLPALTLFFAIPFAAAQTSAPPIRVDVRLVNVYVNVADENGSPVGGLDLDDFTLTEDGHPQKISVFERQTQTPLAISLAIDTSGSVRKDMAAEERAAHEFAHALLRPVDQMQVVEFNSHVREVVPFTNNIKRIDSGLDHLGHGPATAVYRAVSFASQKLAMQGGRKVLVLVSDGGNTVHGVNYDEALEQAVRAEAMVYSLIDVPIQADAGRDEGGEHAMIALSQETGGKYYYVDGEHLEQAFEKVSEDLRTQYLLGYYPARRVADSDFRAISVTLKNLPANAHYSVHSRTGYYATPQ